VPLGQKKNILRHFCRVIFMAFSVFLSVLKFHTTKIDGKFVYINTNTNSETAKTANDFVDNHDHT